MSEGGVLDNTSLAALVIEELWRLGVRHVVAAPGSRSTPLVAATARHPHLEAFVLHDERGAGFFALGLGKATGRPVVVLTTSGTAVANLLPAVVEADQSRVPLVVLSADRPFEAHGTDANQTVDQQRLFGARARAFLCLPPPEQAGPPAALLRALDEAVARASGPLPGPVHVNAMFRKPLEPGAPPALEALPGLAAWAEGAAPFARPLATRARPEPAAILEVEGLLRRAARGLIVAGSMASGEEAAGARALAEALGWPLVTDPLSGLRASLAGSPLAITHASLLAKAGLLEGAPDVVLWTGGTLVSPDVAAYAASARTLVRVDPRARLRLEAAPEELVVAAEPGDLAELLAARAPFPKSALLSPLREAEAAARALLDEELGSVDDALDEPAVALEVAARAPRDGALFVGNSMPVRDVDLFAPAGRGAERVFANRGASGIDGLLSTAAGVAASGVPSVALLGDLSFLHDAGSLSGLSRLPLDLRVVVVDNRGGGIFDFLPIAAHKELFERWFTTPHDVDLVALASAYGVRAQRVGTRAQLRDALDAEVRGLEVIVVPTARMTNVDAHRARYAALRRALGRPR